MRFKSSFGLAVICAFVLAMPAWSHHSHGNYVTDSFMDLQGVVKEVHFVVPHSWVYLEVKDAKASRRYGRSRPRVAPASKASASRATTSNQGTPSKQDATV